MVRRVAGVPAGAPGHLHRVPGERSRLPRRRHAQVAEAAPDIREPYTIC